MPGSTIVRGSARKELVRQSNLSAPGSMELGVFDTGLYARFAGFASIIGSATVRYRSAINSGIYLVSSSFVINSGPSTFDVLNYAHVTEFWFSAISSQVVSGILIYGEPIR